MAFDVKKFGAAIRTLRENIGLSQAALAEQAGLTQAAVALIEQGKRSVSMQTLDTLGQALKVPSECLSILAFRAMAKQKDIADLAKSLQNLILATVEARSATVPASRRRAATRKRGSTRLARVLVGAHQD